MRTYTFAMSIHFLLLVLAIPLFANGYSLLPSMQLTQAQKLLVAQSQQDNEKIPHRGSGRREVVTTSALVFTA